MDWVNKAMVAAAGFGAVQALRDQGFCRETYATSTTNVDIGKASSSSSSSKVMISMRQVEKLRQSKKICL
ncbi:hypothetical protein QJS04_geneDACA021982 [Acorus gramineus]|uniref:Uncharacterized protein n=1 Tax=Acorus gramineus TaxID=55184 RepID=A0AAV9A9H0_ACOGR|nr:hypothetical protein QJS04_geneDACA021982 [Acorus gramineus]